jgi:salicylate hydroxylase
MAFEDGAVLAKLFSHLLSEDQIGSFLCAFQDLRYERVTRMLRNENMNLMFQTVPPGDIQRGRDQNMLEKHRKGQNVLENDGDTGEQWEEIKIAFGYDAEDEADNWWMQWGLLRERARGSVIPGINWDLFVQSVHVDRIEAV